MYSFLSFNPSFLFKEERKRERPIKLSYRRWEIVINLFILKSATFRIIIICLMVKFNIFVDPKRTPFLDLHLQISWNQSIYLQWRTWCFFVTVMPFCPIFVLFSSKTTKLILIVLLQEVCIDFNFSLLFVALSLSLKVPQLMQIYGRFRPCLIILPPFITYYIFQFQLC